MTQQRIAVNRLGNSSVISDTIEVMTIHIVHVELQQEAAIFLAAMLDSHPDNQRLAFQAGAVRVLTKVLRTHFLADDPDLQDDLAKQTHPGIPVWRRHLLEWGPLTLARCTIGSEENQNQFARVKGLSTVCQLLPHAEVSARAAETLCEVVTSAATMHSGNQHAFVDLELFAILSPVLTKFTDEV